MKKLRKTTEGTEDTEKNLILIRLFSVLSVCSVVKYRFFHSFPVVRFFDEALRFNKALVR